MSRIVARLSWSQAQFESMHLIQVLLPLCDNQGNAFAPELFSSVRDELAQRFGGVTIYSRSPAEGIWQDEAEHAVHDEVILFEVMTEDLDRPWWTRFRRQQERRFEQEEVVIRAQAITRL